MRIIAGEFKSRKIYSPPDDAQTRPIPDRVKESLFSLLRGHFEGVEVFDAFSGTGTIGLEAVSRGASRVVFIEKDREVVASLKANIDLLGCAERCEVFTGDALGPGALSRCPSPAHLIFLDPPYAMIERPASRARVFDQAARLAQRLDDSGYLILRTPWPAMDKPDPAPGEAGGAPEPERRGRKGSRERKGRDACDVRGGAEEPEAMWEIGDEGEPESLEWDDAEVVDADEESAAAEAPPAPPRQEISLAIEGTVGPETHVYRGTAVHLYMRKREGIEASRD